MNTIDNPSTVVGMSLTPAPGAVLRRAVTQVDDTPGTAAPIDIPVTISARRGST